MRSIFLLLSLFFASFAHAQANEVRFQQAKLFDLFVGPDPKDGAIALINVYAGNFSGDRLVWYRVENGEAKLTEFAVDQSVLLNPAIRDSVDFRFRTANGAPIQLKTDLVGYINIDITQDGKLTFSKGPVTSSTLPAYVRADAPEWSTYLSKIKSVGSFVPARPFDPDAHFPIHPLVKDYLLEAIAIHGMNQPMSLLPLKAGSARGLDMDNLVFFVPKSAPFNDISQLKLALVYEDRVEVYDPSAWRRNKTLVDFTVKNRRLQFEVSDLKSSFNEKEGKDFDIHMIITSAADSIGFKVIRDTPSRSYEDAHVAKKVVGADMINFMAGKAPLGPKENHPIISGFNQNSGSSYHSSAASQIDHATQTCAAIF